MKTIVSLISALTALAMSSAMAQTTYLGTGDANGTTADGDGFSSVVVNNTASTISFTINTTQNQASFIFYAIELQIIGQAGSGYTGHANPFGPAVGISSGENAVIDTFGTGATPYTSVGLGFSLVAGPSVSYAAGGTGTTSTTIVVPLSSLGLSVGQSFYFDAVSTYTSQAGTPPGPQAAYGALDNKGFAAESDGSFKPYLGSNFYDSATDATGTVFGTSASEYTVTAVPEPTTCALIGLGALVMIRRVVRRKF